MTPNLHIERDDSTQSPDDESFRRWVSAVLTHTHHPDDAATEISLRVNGLKEMTDLNSRFRNRTGPTNVLSFPADLPIGVDVPLLGDIVICASVVATEAREQNKVEEWHWAHLTVHGVLHLLGYEHDTDSDAETMEALEIDILHGLNVPNPYADGDPNLRTTHR